MLSTCAREREREKGGGGVERIHCAHKISTCNIFSPFLLNKNLIFSPIACRFQGFCAGIAGTTSKHFLFFSITSKYSQPHLVLITGTRSVLINLCTKFKIFSAI